MFELLRTNDLVLISAIEALLNSEGIKPFIADQAMSAMEGSVGFLPRRICVAESQAQEARQILIDAGFGPELPQG
jgi:hypothetical protein